MVFPRLGKKEKREKELLELCGSKLTCPIYTICEVQASKAQCTPNGNCYNSQTSPNMTKVKTRKVNFSKRRIYLCKISKSHFCQI